MFLAVENHCDFTGVEMAEIFDMVDSLNVGCALDTADGFLVLCDPNDDVKVLAAYAITTHIKDVVVLKDPVGWRIPFYPAVCPLGVIETGWRRYGQEFDAAQKDAHTADN